MSKNEIQPTNITSEKIRTVFDNGYKMAMLQTKISLTKEISLEEDVLRIKILEKLLNEIEDRLETQKCFNLYKGWFDETLLQDAKKRDDEFKPNLKADMTKWGDRSM